MPIHSFDLQEPESGFIGDPEKEFRIESGFTDIEVIHISRINVIARGRRYGRMWLLKSLRGEEAFSPAYRRQMQKEFEIQSRLHHPGVAQAVAIENIQGFGACIVTEWVEGKSLAHLLREGNLSAAERRGILRDIIEATAYIHSRGVVHRDLKPSNIIVREAGGKAVIIDFGLADTGDYVELKQSSGTPGYISPEQATSAGAAPSDDIFSIGVIMTALCPEYISIARRCTGPLTKRPKDCTRLLRMIDRRERRPRRILTAIAFLLMLLLSGAGALRIHSLSRSSEEARAAIASARHGAEEANRKAASLSEENRRNAFRVTELTDSLQGVTARMMEAEKELRHAEELTRSREKAYRDGCTRIDALLAKADREIFSKFGSIDKSFNDALSQLHEDVRHICDSSVEPDTYPLISSAEREKIRLDIYNHYLNTLTSYQQKWLKRIYPEMN